MSKSQSAPSALPEAMTGSPPDSWAHDTIVRRWPEILDRIFKENELPSDISTALRVLKSEIPDSPIVHIDDPNAPDIATWQDYVAPYIGMDWLSPPWFFCEHYFYRRVMAAIGYFSTGGGDASDPFDFQKRHGLIVSRATIQEMTKRLTDWLRAPFSPAVLKQLIYIDLWGNQADLSLWPADKDNKPDHDTQHQAQAFLLADDADRIIEHIQRLPADNSRVDVLVDNAGVELTGDLILADYLLSKNLVSAVRLHLKPHPTYVSDAMIKDVHYTERVFETDEDPHIKALGNRLIAFERENRLQLADDFFWTSPLPSWQMPDPLRRILSESNLIVSKGDAHYRRLLGDLAWPTTTAFSSIVSYSPAPIAALRTLKAEIACGMTSGQEAVVAAEDPEWMTSGRWGVIQFYCNNY